MATQQQGSLQYLCFGDLVFLLNDESDEYGGVAEAEGFGEANSIGIMHPAPLPTEGKGKRSSDEKFVSGTFANKMVFTIYHAIAYTQAEMLRKAEGGDNDADDGSTTRRTPRTNQAEQVLRLAHRKVEAQKESKRNETEFEVIKGRELRYGMIITLRHVCSGKFLSVSSLSSEREKDMRKVVLSDEIGDAMYIRVMPQLSLVHAEGERVHESDPLELMSVPNPGLRLQVSRFKEPLKDHDGRDASRWLEILGATNSNQAFKLSRFRSLKAEAKIESLVSKPLIFGGQPLRILHMQGNSYVNLECDHENTTLRIQAKAEISFRRGAGMSSNQIWQIEHVSARDGRSVKWDSLVRLRHGATGRLLSVAPEYCGSNAKFGAGETAPTMLNPAGDDERTLFQLYPQYPELAEAAVSTGSQFHLRHVDSSSWLHCPADEVSADEVKDLKLLVCHADDPKEADVYKFEMVFPSFMRDMLYARSCVEVLSVFESHFRRKGDLSKVAAQEQASRSTRAEGQISYRPAVSSLPGGRSSPTNQASNRLSKVTATVTIDQENDRDQYERLERVLTDLVIFCSLSDNPDPMTREGLPKADTQKLLCELGILELSMSIVKTLLEPLLALRAHDTSRGLAKRLTMLIKLCQRLMWNVLRKNKFTCTYTANKVEADGHSSVFVVPLQKQMGYGIMAAQTLREIYVDNGPLLDEVGDSLIEEFIELIRSNEAGKGRRARYLEFLMVLCVCEGKAVRTNQWRIARLLIENDENRRLLLQLSLKASEKPGQRVHIIGDQEFFPTFRGKIYATDSKSLHQQMDAMKLIEWLKAPPSVDEKKRADVDEKQRAEELEAAAALNPAELQKKREASRKARAESHEADLKLAADHRDVRAYFMAMVELYHLLVVGRNEKNTKLLRSLLPYEVVETIIMSPTLHDEKPSKLERAGRPGARYRHPYMGLCATFSAIARSLYVDSYTFHEEPEPHTLPHETMTRIKTMRIWKNVEEVEASGKLSSRITTKLNIQWEKFSKLQCKIYAFLRDFADRQVATRVELNHLVLELLKLLHDMILFGFLPSGAKSTSELAESGAAVAKKEDPRRSSAFSRISSGYSQLEEEEEEHTAAAASSLQFEGDVPTVREFIPILLRVVDGTGDTFDEADGEEEEEDDEEDKSVIAAKEAAAKAKAKKRYIEWKTVTHDTVVIMHCKLWACKVLQLVCTLRVDIRLSRLLKMYKAKLPQIEQEEKLSFLTSNPHLSDAQTTNPWKRAVGKSQLVTIMQTLKIPQVQTDQWFHNILIDCMFYQSAELAETAMSLLIRMFEQKSTLKMHANKVQLLYKRRMSNMYGLFEELLRRLIKFTGRRRLFEELDESFQTAQILGQLTSWLYEHNETGQKSALNTTGTDHAQFIYLKVIGKATVSVNSKEIYVEMLARCLQPEATMGSAAGSNEGDLEEPMLVKGDEIQLEGGMYRVVEVRDRRAFLDRPFQWPEASPEDDEAFAFPTDAKLKSATVWVMKLKHIIKPDRDMQLMLFNLQNGAIIREAIRLLDLPFALKALNKDDMKTRAVVRAVYRLLKAFCSNFPSGQTMLAPYLKVFLPHCVAELVSMDISPMGCINAIYKDNYSNCSAVDIETVETVVELAAEKYAPRMLRFLLNLIEANGKLIKSNQTLVIQALDSRKRALFLCETKESRRELVAMIANNEHEKNPRGKLMYHFEVVKLLAVATKPQNGKDHIKNQKWVQLRFTLAQLDESMRTCSLPPRLMMSYIDLLKNTYLGQPEGRLIQVEQTLRKILSDTTAQLEELRRAPERISERGTTMAQQVRMEAMVLESLIPCLIDLYRRHPTLILGEENDVGPEEAGGADRSSVADEGGVEKLGDELLDDLLRFAKVIKGGAEQPGRPPTPIDLSNERDEPLRQLVLFIVRNEKEAENRYLDAMGHTVQTGSAAPLTLAIPSTVATSLALPSTKAPPTETTPATPMSSERQGSSGHPQDYLSTFVDGLISEADEKREFEDLVAIFKRDVELTASGKQTLEDSRTRKLIEQLMPGRAAEVEMSEEYLHQTCTSLRLLVRLVKSTSSGYVLRRQLMLNEMGASAVALSMAASDAEELCEWGLQLCMALLSGGNKEVQFAMLSLLSDPLLQRHCTPFDGSKSTFLASMRERIRLGAKEITARKLYEEQQRALRITKEEDTAHLGAAARKRYLDNLEQPFKSKANVLHVLCTLQLLCEGHNTTLQDYMRLQPDEPTNVDLVAELFHLFESLSMQENLDASNVDQLLQCLATMTELVQGNVSGGTAAALLPTKLLDQLTHLMEREVPKSHRKPDNQKNRKLTRIHTVEVKCQVSVLLLALVESESEVPGLVHERMLRTLDLDTLVGIVQDGYETIDTTLSGIVHNEDEAKAVDVLRETGLTIYIVLRYLLDFEWNRRLSNDTIAKEPERVKTLDAIGGNDPRKKDTPRLVGEARRHYARHVGSVEICNSQGVLQKYFFPIKPACLLLLSGNRNAMPDVAQLKENPNKTLWGVDTMSHTDLRESYERGGIFAARRETATLHSSKKALLWSVDRTKRSEMLKEFVKGIEDLQFEMNHLGNLQKEWWWGALSGNTLVRQVAFESTFIIALFQNAVLLMRYSGYSNPVETVANVVMGMAQVFSCIMTFAFVLIQSGPLHLKRKDLWPSTWKPASFGVVNRKKSLWEQDKPPLSLLDHVRLSLQAVVALLSDAHLLTALILLFAALLGLFISPLWFSLHLIDMVNKSAELKNVFRSLTFPGKALALTFTFAVLIIYIYAAAGYGMFPRRAFMETESSSAWHVASSQVRHQNDLGESQIGHGHHGHSGPTHGRLLSEHDLGVAGSLEHFLSPPLNPPPPLPPLPPSESPMTEDAPDHYCSNLLYCWLAAVNDGLRYGDIGAIMQHADPYDAWYQYLAVVVYEFSFYCFIVTMLLSLIFGLIIDTFSMLRTKDTEKEKHMNGVCFICGVDRRTLDMQGHGFEAHIRNEHNMWEYAFMLIHIREKAPLDYNGWEAYVAAKIEDDDFSFIPSNNAISLSEYNARKVRESTVLLEKVNQMEATLEAAVGRMSDLSKQVEYLSGVVRPEVGGGERSLASSSKFGSIRRLSISRRQ